LVKADIQNFFPSISQERIVSVFRSLGMSARPAQRLARFLTIEQALPLGLPASPVVSNLVVLGLDQQFETLALGRNIKYTRYADDLTFSGDGRLPARGEIRTILAQHGFALSERKFKFSKRGQAHFVTGLSVSEPDYPRVPRRMKARLRQELHFCEKFGLEGHADRLDESVQRLINRLAGTVDYVCFMERRHASGIRAKWNRILAVSSKQVEFESLSDQERRIIDLIIDETELDIAGEKYLAICVVRIGDDIAKFAKLIRTVLRDYISNPAAKGNLSKIRKRGAHFTDLHYDLRSRVFDLIMGIPWSAAILLAKISSPEDYDKTWLRLFERGMKQEFAVSDGATVNIGVEENDKVTTTALGVVVNGEFERLSGLGLRRPVSRPTVVRLMKSEDDVLAFPDFVLAAFRAFAMQVQDESILDFERIRDKVRYICDLDRNEFYDRKNPFVGLAHIASG
jgi:hypothetical protein